AAPAGRRREPSCRAAAAGGGPRGRRGATGMGRGSARGVGCAAMPDLTTPRLPLHALTLEEGEALHAGEPLEAWTFAPGYPLPDTRDGVDLFVRHQVVEFGFYLAVRRDDGLVIGEIGFAGPPTNGA